MGPSDPSPLPVRGPSQYTWAYSSKVCPEQRKVTEAARAGLKKADVNGPAAEGSTDRPCPAAACSRPSSQCQSPPPKLPQESSCV